MSPPVRSSDPIVALEGVTKRFGATAVLDGFDLALGRGEVVSLIGPSGCGKSTVLRLIAGLESADAGRVRAPDRGVGHVFQDATLMPWASALDNAALPLRFARVGRGEARARARAALEGVGLGAALDKRPAELSGGMRMRVALARALVGEAEVLLLDEPFAALDEITRFRLNDDLTALAARRGLSILFVTHSVYEAVGLSDRIAVMSTAGGRIEREIAVTAPEGRGAAFRGTTAFAEQAAAVSRALAEVVGASEGGPIDALPDRE